MIAERHWAPTQTSSSFVRDRIWKKCMGILKTAKFGDLKGFTLDDVNLSVIRSSADASKRFFKGIKIPEVLTVRLSSFPLPFFFFSFKCCSDFASNSLSIASTFEENVFLPTTVRQVGLPGTSNLATSLASSANCRTQWQEGYTSWWYNGRLTFFFRTTRHLWKKGSAGYITSPNSVRLVDSLL